MAASIKATKGEPTAIRRAKGFAYHLDHIELPIYEAEQLIGSVTGMWPVDEERNKLTYEDYYKMAVEALDAHEATRGEQEERESRSHMSDGEGNMSFEENANSGKMSPMRSARFWSLLLPMITEKRRRTRCMRLTGRLQTIPI